MTELEASNSNISRYAGSGTCDWKTVCTQLPSHTGHSAAQPLCICSCTNPLQLQAKPGVHFASVLALG